jgi:hypothetical protein
MRWYVGPESWYYPGRSMVVVIETMEQFDARVLDALAAQARVEPPAAAAHPVSP